MWFIILSIITLLVSFVFILVCAGALVQIREDSKADQYPCSYTLPEEQGKNYMFIPVVYEYPLEISKKEFNTQYIHYRKDLSNFPWFFNLGFEDIDNLELGGVFDPNSIMVDEEDIHIIEALEYNMQYNIDFRNKRRLEYAKTQPRAFAALIASGIVCLGSIFLLIFK